MVSQRNTLQRQGVPIRAQLEGPRVYEQRATYTSRTAAPPRSRRNRVRQNRTRRNINIGEYRKYGPTQAGDKASGIGLLEAEFFGIVILLIVQLFVSSSSYGDKIMSFMKRGLLTAVLFFFLALIAGIGPNAAKVSKGLGGLVFVMILISTPGQDIVNSLDNFFKANWTGTSESASTSADKGTQEAAPGNVQKAQNAASNAANTITSINLPGIGPVFAFKDAYDALKKLFHL